MRVTCNTQFYLWECQDNIPTQSAKRHLQDVLKMSYQDKQDILPRHLAKTSCRCPKDVLNANLKVIFVRHLEDIFTRYIVDVLAKTP